VTIQARSDSQIAFQPWRDQDRYESGFKGHRILVLGESHYHSCEDDPACREETDETVRTAYHSQMTYKVVDWWKDKPHRSPLSYRVPKLFGEDQKEVFWPKVAFYNYVQEFVGPAARVRPSEELWAERRNAQAFQEVLDTLRPDRILVLGKKLWTNLESKSPPLARRPEVEEGLPVSSTLNVRDHVDKGCYWYFTSSDHRALAMPIMHPAAVRFSLDEWITPITDWLSFDR
jgi:hypothetical protein